ncbi:unnamed protein product [Effrenium voratum]|nr:unnamed protein product [Effrenium voratum]
MVRALAALAALALAWAELLRDDECLDGSCALSALQLKAKPEVDLDILCSKADSVCSALGDDGGPSLTDLRQLLAVANSTFQAFSDAIDLHNLVENELVPCKALCVASAKLLVRQSITLPRQPDVGCFRNAAGVDVCNVDLSPAKLRKRFGSGKKRFAKLQDAAGALPSRIKKWQHRNWEDPLQHAFESQVQSYSAELALRILYMPCG